jgi:acyl-CoA thioester hydrolase
MPSEFETTRRVAFADTDLAGIVHFANFYRYMEDAEHEFFRSLGLKMLNRQTDGSVISWPRVSAACNFKAPAHYEDILRIRLVVARVGVKSLTYKIDIFRDETLLARGEVKTVCCLFRHGEGLKSMEIPAEYHAVIQEHPDE